MNASPATTAITGSLVDLCDRCGFAIHEVTALRRASLYSHARLESARRLLAGRSLQGVSVFALGSFGRGDASGCSDLDLGCIYDPARCSEESAQEQRALVIGLLRNSFEIPEKTFTRPIPRQAMLASIGGSEDTNSFLTHRALLLTEGAWLDDEAQFTEVYRATFGAYTRGEATRGRTLGALANELARYYRTVCVDFRHKVEIHEKSWALRVLKLRHSRKLWHLGNMCLHLWTTLVQSRHDALSRTERDALLQERLVWPSLSKIALLLEALDMSELCREFVLLYDTFLTALEDASRREVLERLRWDEREQCADFLELRHNADRLDEASIQLIEGAWPRVKSTLVRFWLL